MVAGCVVVLLVVRGSRCYFPQCDMRFVIETGKQWHQALEKGASGKLEPAGWKCGKQLQRVHKCRESARGIEVKLVLDGDVDSDAYAYRADAASNLWRSSQGQVRDMKTLAFRSIVRRML